MSAAWLQVCSFAGAVVYAVWCCADVGDDGVEVPLRRLREIRGWAATIDPGVALAHELAARS